MELRQLKYFVKTAKTLNFSEAAKALFVTQSTLSQQIRQLEQEIDTVLFVRDSHSVQITESGERLLPLAERTLKDATSCLDMVRDLKNMLSGSLNIGITYTFAPILTQTVIAFTKAHPAIKLNIFYKTMEELMVMLEKRELDFVLSFKRLISLTILIIYCVLCKKSESFKYSITIYASKLLFVLFLFYCYVLL
jgi:LysR family cyn operon transcriptional activator